MKKLLIGLVSILMMFGLSGVSQALTFDQVVYPDIIMGTPPGGIGNGSFTVDRSNGIELGLRGKTRWPSPDGTFNSNGDGSYDFAVGGPVMAPGNRAWWSVEWSINTDLTEDSLGYDLDDLTYEFGIDNDPTAATNFIWYNYADIINGGTFWDHSIGTNTTGHALGVEATDATTYAALLSSGKNVAQNSWQAHWLNPSLNPSIDATYDFYLAAFVRDATGANNMRELARTEIQIIVGQGGAPVPEPATLLLLGFGLLGVAGLSRKKN